MFFIGQNLKHVHMTFSFHEYLIFFWPTLDEMLYVKTNFMGSQSWNTNHEPVSDIDIEKTSFLM